MALVLAGGGARGAYEAGALAELLPALAPEERPRILVGTSVGALNVAHYAANAHRPVADQVGDAVEMWGTFGYGDVLAPLLSLSSALRLGSYLQGVAGLPGAPVRSVLDPGPLADTVGRVVDFERLNANAEDATLHVAAVATTSASSNLTVVFHAGGPAVERDVARGVEYVRTDLSLEHVVASAAIPVLFPAVHVPDGPGAGWYFDGGTRLNTPIKPALALGAGRVIVIALNSLMRRDGGLTSAEPTVFDGVGQLIGALLVDPLVNDVHTMARRNELAAIAPDAAGEAERVVPYIMICPPDPDEIARLAMELFRERYGGLLRSVRSGVPWGRDRSLAVLGRFLHGGAGVAQGEVLSLLYFANEFLAAVLELGRRDARAWLRAEHDDGVWQRGRL